MLVVKIRVPEAVEKAVGQTRENLFYALAWTLLQRFGVTPTTQSRTPDEAARMVGDKFEVQQTVDPTSFMFGPKIELVLATRELEIINSDGETL